jgi:peptidoglycan hydrolase-like protein with peptidoglycan-binding domain
MMRHFINLYVLLFFASWAAMPVMAASIPIENYSFEAPVVDPNGFGAVPLVDGWTEVDIDALFSTNTGVFANTEPNSFDHIVNADGSQLAFLGSQMGNALQQDLEDVYKAGCAYSLTVGVSVSGRFPPSAVEPVDTLELVLYYLDANDVIDIASQAVEATGQSYTELQDFSLELPVVRAGDAWVGKAIGIALRASGQPGGFWDLDNVRLFESAPVLIPIENASFEAPVVDPNGFGAVPLVDGWTEVDIDALFSTNTGVFANTEPNSFDHVVNADGSQLAFLGSQTGNALQQDLDAVYKSGCSYSLTVGVSVSGRFPPSAVEPVDTLELVLYYLDANDVIDIASQAVEATEQSYTELQDFSLELPVVWAGDAWAGRAIGIALRASGQPGGFWDLDNVRLVESIPAPDNVGG